MICHTERNRASILMKEKETALSMKTAFTNMRTLMDDLHHLNLKEGDSVEMVMETWIL